MFLDDEVVLSVFDVRNTQETRTQDLRLCYVEDRDAEVSFWKFVDCCSRSCGRSTPARRSGEKVFRVHMVRLFVRRVTASPSPKSSCSPAVSLSGPTPDEKIICQRHVSRRLQRVVGTRCWPKLHKVNNIARTSSHGALHPCGRLLWHGLVLVRPGGRAALAFLGEGAHHSLKTTGTI